MADAGTVLAAAIAERDHIAGLLDKHDRACGYCAAIRQAHGGPASAWPRWACDARRSLAAHLARAQQQADLLTPPPTGEMF